MLKTKLPNFFVVGTQKAGTTSLHDWLLQTKNVCLPSLKETHFFSSSDNFQKGVDWYISQFSKCSQENLTYGEICPEYLYSKIAPHNIKKLIQNPKLIFILRHPIERAFSQFIMARRNGYENQNFVNALYNEKSRILKSETFRSRFGYFDRSMYFDQIQRYRSLFSDKLMLFIKFEDLTDNDAIGEMTFNKICQFIGLPEPTKNRVNRNVKKNTASTSRSFFIRDLLYNDFQLKKYIRFLLPRKESREKIAFIIDNLNRKEIKELHIPSIPDLFINKTMDEISKLEHSCELDLSDWKERTISYA